MQHKLQNIVTGTQPLVDAITHHKLFGAVNSLARLRRFSEIHVYAVWDFISLLKSLQRKITSQQVLWSPPANPLGCYLINSLLAEEESDCLEQDRYLSHFELYIQAMEQCGADTRLISDFITNIPAHQTWVSLLDTRNLPEAARRFVQDTFVIIEKEPHAIAASLAFAREQITSDMFGRLLQAIKPSADSGYSLELFKTYLQRHIDLDSGKRSQQSQSVVANLCGEEDYKWQEAFEAAQFSLNSRLQLLDGIYRQVLDV